MFRRMSHEEPRVPEKWINEMTSQYKSGKEGTNGDLMNRSQVWRDVYSLWDVMDL